MATVHLSKEQLDAMKEAIMRMTNVAVVQGVLRYVDMKEWGSTYSSSSCSNEFDFERVDPIEQPYTPPPGVTIIDAVAIDVSAGELPATVDNRVE